MKQILLSATVTLAMSLTSCNGQQKQDFETKKEEKMELSDKEKAIALLNSFNTGDQTPVSYINPNKYIQHNLAIGDGLAGFGAVMQNAPEGGFKADVKRAFQDGDYVVTHTQYDFFGPKAGIDIFRFENGLIVEHWDNMTDVAPPNPSGRTQFDGVSEVTDLDKTEENKVLVESFVNDILVNSKMEKLAGYFDGDKYIQHNLQTADGLSGLGKALEYMASQGIKMKYDKIHKVLGEGNFVLVVSEGSYADKHTSFYDLFRVENGKIAEHWDVVETIMPKSEWKNNNGKF